MSNSFKLYPTHFSRGEEIFSRGASPPGYGPGYMVRERLGTPDLDLVERFVQTELPTYFAVAITII